MRRCAGCRRAVLPFRQSAAAGPLPLRAPPGPLTVRGSELGLGAEFAWAHDLRVMADGDFFIGQPEVLLGIMPGGGGTQRLTRLIGTHQSLVAILEGRPFTPAEALANGAVDEVVAREDVLPRATELAKHFGSRP